MNHRRYNLGDIGPGRKLFAYKFGDDAVVGGKSVLMPITLGAPVSDPAGGEGVVFEVEEHSNLVAKIYKPTAFSSDLKKSDLVRKLQRVDRYRGILRDRYPFILVPGRPVYRIDEPKDSSFVGYLMWKMTGFKPLVDFLEEGNLLDQDIVLRLGAACACALQAMHEPKLIPGVNGRKGHVVGPLLFCDFNPKNVFIDLNSRKDGAPIVIFIDADSYEYNIDGALYKSNVWHLQYSSPRIELAKDYKAAHGHEHFERLQSDDVYSFATVLFLMAVGANPFKGRQLPDQLDTVEDMQRRGDFPYGDEGEWGALPSNALSRYKQIPAELKDLFADTFDRNFRDDFAKNFDENYLPPPTAYEWATALKKAIGPEHANKAELFPSLEPITDAFLDMEKRKSAEVERLEEEGRYFGLYGMLHESKRGQLDRTIGGLKDGYDKLSCRLWRWRRHPVVNATGRAASAGANWALDAQRRVELKNAHQRLAQGRARRQEVVEEYIDGWFFWARRKFGWMFCHPGNPVKPTFLVRMMNVAVVLVAWLFIAERLTVVSPLIVAWK